MRGSSPRMTNERALAALLHLDRLPRDVAAAEAVGPFYAVDRFVSARLRLTHRLAHRADVEHTPTIGEDRTVLRHRAGVKNLDAVDLAGLVEPVNARALLVVAGIALRG